MCRMIVASGDFDTRDILAAAVSMSCGQTAAHDNRTTRHRHGWGAVWRRPDGTLACHRDPRPAAESSGESPLAAKDGVRTDFLAIHVRNATLEAKQGIRFTHPLTRASDDWHFMHNGYMPTVHRLLGLDQSEFDSAEYFDYLIPPGTPAATIDSALILRRLGEVPPPGSTSANAVAVHPHAAHVVHWSPADTPTPKFFTLHEFTADGMSVISSEVVPALATPGQWRQLAPGAVRTIQFARPSARLVRR